MADFPTLSIPPIFPIEIEREDNVIRSQSEAGYELTRPRWTRIRKTFTVKYQLLTPADKALLDTFIDTTTCGAYLFNWTNPADSTVYSVRFAVPPKVTIAMADGSTYYYDAEFKFKEV